VGDRQLITSFKGVGHDYRLGERDLSVLDDITFDVMATDRIAIVGPSGAGKSTILKVALGLIQPTRGEVAFGSGGETALRRSIVFQDPTLMPWLTALENVKLPLRIAGRTGDLDAIASEALEAVGLGEFLGYRPAQLSGGMQSRVALARALAVEPDLMLLDEPFSNLDEATSEELVVDLSRFIDQNHAAVIMITHSLTQAVFMADRVMVLSPRPGRIFREVSFPSRQARTPDRLLDPEFYEQVRTVRQVLREALHADSKTV
jgi:NitT/TauT family transport system ATP-binding protein